LLPVFVPLALLPLTVLCLALGTLRARAELLHGAILGVPASPLDFAMWFRTTLGTAVHFLHSQICSSSFPLGNQGASSAPTAACLSRTAVPRAGCGNRQFPSMQPGCPCSTCLLLPPSPCAAFSAEQHSPFATSHVCISYLTSADSCTLLLCGWPSPCTPNVIPELGKHCRPLPAHPCPGTPPAAPSWALGPGLLQGCGCGGNKAIGCGQSGLAAVGCVCTHPLLVGSAEQQVRAQQLLPVSIKLFPFPLNQRLPSLISSESLSNCVFSCETSMQKKDKRRKGCCSNESPTLHFKYFDRAFSSLFLGSLIKAFKRYSFKMVIASQGTCL